MYKGPQMITWRQISFLAQLTFFAASSALAQTSGSDLSADEVKALVTDKVWNITIGGGDPNVTAFWDFKADGSLCGRLRGGTAQSKCADDGKWKIQGDTLCWDFKWIGEQYGYKSLCGRVRKGDATSYQLIDPAGKYEPVLFRIVTSGPSAQQKKK